MDPLHNLVLARFLVSLPKGQPTEACHRGGCGRAYYAAFVVSRDALEDGGISVTSGRGTHQAVISALKRSRSSDIKAAGASLESLHELRKKADYEVGRRAKAVFPPNDAKFALAYSKAIINAITAGKKKSKRLQIP